MAYDFFWFFQYLFNPAVIRDHDPIAKSLLLLDSKQGDRAAPACKEVGYRTGIDQIITVKDEKIIIYQFPDLFYSMRCAQLGILEYVTDVYPELYAIAKVVHYTFFLISYYKYDILDIILGYRVYNMFKQRLVRNRYHHFGAGKRKGTAPESLSG